MNPSVAHHPGHGQRREDRSPRIRAAHSPLAFAISAVCFLAMTRVAPAADATNYPRGLAASLDHDASTTRLRAKAIQSPSSPLLVRVSNTAANAQRIEFIGTIAGEYDLRDYLEREDGTPASLPPLPIRIVSQLPPDHGTDVLGDAPTGFSLRAHYRTIVFAVAAAWALVPVVVFIRRAMNKPAPIESAPTVLTATIADELRAMLDAAGTAPLSTSQRGRLELLLMHYWCERLARDESNPTSGSRHVNPAHAIALLREHPRTQSTVLGLERWLHQREGAPDESAAALLAEFRRSELVRAEPSIAHTGTLGGTT